METRAKSGPTALFIILFLCCLFVGETRAEVQEEGDLLQQMIELVVEANPTLVSQNRIVLESRNLPEPWWLGMDNIQVNLTGGYGTQVMRREGEDIIEFVPTAGVNIAFPIFSPSKWQESGRQQFEVEKAREDAQQRYLSLKKSVISELLEKVWKISELENKKESLGKLKTFLEDQSDGLRKQIKAGVARPSELWDLKERIMETDTEIRNLSNQVKTLKRETAVNLGGERWKELFEMLDRVKLELPGG